MELDADILQDLPILTTLDSESLNSPITIDEVRQAINDLRPHSAVGAFGINATILRLIFRNDTVAHRITTAL